MLGLQKHASELPKGLDLSKYVASGVVAFDLRTRAVKWSTHLDLSTDSTTFRAYVYSSPTLADIDRDGKLEVVIGTSVVRPPPPPAARPTHIHSASCTSTAPAPTGHRKPRSAERASSVGTLRQSAPCASPCCHTRRASMRQNKQPACTHGDHYVDGTMDNDG